MLAERPLRGVGVAIERRLREPGMLRLDSARAYAVREKSIALRLLVERVAEAQEPRRRAGRHQGEVETPVERAPRLEARARIAGARQRRGLELAVRRADGREPLGVAEFDRSPEDHRLDVDPCVRDVAQPA